MILEKINEFYEMTVVEDLEKISNHIKENGVDNDAYTILGLFSERIEALRNSRSFLRIWGDKELLNEQDLRS